MEKRLFRNEYEKVVAGVSSGIAEYMEVDVTIIRLLFVLSTFFLVGTGILVYLVMWIVVPVNNDPAKRFAKFTDHNKGFTNPFESKPNPQGWTSSTINDEGFKNTNFDAAFKPQKKNNETGKTIVGLILLVIGIYFLMNEFNIIPFWFNIGKLWPLLFVAIGVSFIMKSKNKTAWEEWKRQTEQQAETPSAPQTPVEPEGSVTETVVTETVVTETQVTGQPISEAPKADDRFTKKDI
ncbi:MAG: PspC domain-containing protein [Bacteroidota bacterium]